MRESGRGGVGMIGECQRFLGLGGLRGLEWKGAGVGRVICDGEENGVGGVPAEVWMHSQSQEGELVDTTQHIRS